MKLDQFVIGIVIFGLAIFVYTLMIADVNDNYSSVDLNESKYSEIYNTIDDSYDLSQSMKESSVGSDIEEEESWESMTKGGYSAVRQIITTPVSLVGDILEAIADEIGIPAPIIKVAMIVLTLSIIFSIIFLFMRYKP